MARHCLGGVAAKQAVAKLDHRLLRLITVDSEAIVITLFVLNGKDILRDIDQATREITRVSRLEGGIDKPLASTTRCHEGLQARQPSLEVATHWQLNLAVSSIHLDTDHRTGQLNIVNATTSTRVHHRCDRGIHVGQLAAQEVLYLAVDGAPVVDGQCITLVLSDKPLVELLRDRSRTCVTLSHEVSNFVEAEIVFHTSRHRSSGGKAEGQALHAVSSDSSLSRAITLEDLTKHPLELFLGLDVVVVREVLWQDLVKEDTPQGSRPDFTLSPDANRALQVELAHVVG